MDEGLRKDEDPFVWFPTGKLSRKRRRELQEQYTDLQLALEDYEAELDDIYGSPEELQRQHDEIISRDGDPYSGFMSSSDMGKGQKRLFYRNTDRTRLISKQDAMDDAITRTPNFNITSVDEVYDVTGDWIGWYIFMTHQNLTRRKNPMATGTLMALGLGYFLGKSK